MILGEYNSMFFGLPFTPSLDEENKTVSFTKGKVFNCYDLSGNEVGEYRNGCRYKEIEISDLSYEYGDWIFIDARRQVEYSSFYKISKKEREDNRDAAIHALKEIPILIWKAPDGAGFPGEQILSENIFIQDYESCRERGFSIKNDGYEAELYKYKVNPAFVFAPQFNYSKYILGRKLTAPLGEERKQFALKVSVLASLGSQDDVDGAELMLIDELTVTGVTLEDFSSESPLEDRPIYLSYDNQNLSGTYYVPEIFFGGGNIELNFNLITRDRQNIRPDFETQVRGAKYYKNGVSTNEVPITVLAGEEGYYKEIVVTERFFKFTAVTDIIDGIEYVVVEPSGEWNRTTTYYVNGGSNISTSAPIVLQDVNSDPLAEDEFYDGLIEKTYELNGVEISSSAYNEVRSLVVAMDWTPIALWEGDGTPVIDGAGRGGGESKTFARVIHAERRFKRVGNPSDEFERYDNLPPQFFHYGYISITYQPDEDNSGGIPWNLSKKVYIDKSWRELEIIDEFVYKKELAHTICEAQELGGYLYKDVTKCVYEKYQEVLLSYTTSII